MLGLLVGEKSARRVDRCRGQTQRLKLLEEFLGFVIERARLHQPVDRLAQRQTALDIFILWIEQFGRTTKPFEKTFPVIRLIHEDAREAIFALISFRDSSRLAVASSLGHFAGHAIARNDAQKGIGGEHVLQRDIDMLARPVAAG